MRYWRKSVMTRIEQLISEIEEYIDGCKAQPFTIN